MVTTITINLQDTSNRRTREKNNLSVSGACPKTYLTDRTLYRVTP